MSTNTIVIALAVTLIVISVGVIIGARVAAATATAPAGGATTPPAGTARTRVWTFVETHWAKVWATVAAMVVVYMIIHLTEYMLPNVFAAYLKRGGPSYLQLLIATAVFAIIATIPVGKTRTTLLSLMCVLVGGAILTALIPAIAEVGFKSSPVQTAQTQTVRQVPHDLCDNLYKPYTVYSTPSVITGTVGCFVGVKVRSDSPVILIGEMGQESEPIYKDSPDQVLNFRVVEWRTLPGQVAQVQARLFRQ